MRRLKDFARYFFGAGGVCLDAEALKAPVDSDSVDDKKFVRGAVEEQYSFTDATVLKWARTQKTKGLSSAEAQLWRIRSGAHSQSALVVCRRRKLRQLKHIEFKMFTVQDWLKTC